MAYDIFIYMKHTHIHTHTHGGTVGQKMTGAVMRETGTLYSAPGKEGRTEMEGVMQGETRRGTSLLPLTPLVSLSLQMPLIAHSPAPFPSSPTPRDAHLLGIRGHTHSSLRECVFVYVDF